MKSEHRHELQTNDLSKLTQKALAGMEKHGTKIAIIMCLLAVAYAAATIYRSNVSSAQEAAWTEFSLANTADKYAELADSGRFQGTTAAQWARLVGAERRLSQAIQDMFTDRANAVSQLEESIEDFQKLVDNAHPTIKERAIFGLARAQESLGNIEEAAEVYAKLAQDKFSQSIYHEEAKKRAEYLTQADPQAFYGWFKKQAPKPPEQPKPQDGSKKPFGSELQLPGGLPFGAGAGPGPAPTSPVKNPVDESDADKKLPTLGDPPAEKPTEKPTEKSTEKSAEKPAEKPAKKSATTTEATEKDADGSEDPSDGAAKAKAADKDEAAKKPVDAK